MKRAAVVQVSTRGGPFAGVSAAVMRGRAHKMLAHLGLGAVELSVALVDDATIQELNRTYRHKNKPTDVLAFPLQEPVPAKVVPGDDGSGLLGGGIDFGGIPAGSVGGGSVPVACSGGGPAAKRASRRERDTGGGRSLRN